ncbi:ABC-type transport auxiliary lipoprotein family protein [Nitratifractor sp.]
MKSLMTLLFLLVSIVSIDGCSATRGLTLYRLDAPGAKAANARWHRATLRVDFPKGLDEGMSSRIYFVRGDLSRSYYRYSQWSGSLSRLLLGDLYRTLSGSGLFAHVIDYASQAESDYTLETEILRFEHRIDPDGKRSYAVVEIAARLLRSASGSIVRSRRFAYRIPCPSTDAAGFVQAANTALGAFNRDIVRWLSR